MKQELKWYLKFTAILVAFLAIILALPLLIGVWLPDVLAAPRNILAEERHTNGEIVRVVQFWNRIDFYSTQLEHVSQDGTVQSFTLDGDDSKSWRLPLEVSWKEKLAKVTLDGNRPRTVDWQSGDVER